ncbi:protein C10 isoform X1 [Ahaetulla prasina]|uniref:protein C10 isoform X1 n=1 Tax=Ahaetulla prasina TaxID=499056 RepID=UPI00264822DF|nr:protein C10 isoform X1 [Ahaetulla prasina]
MPGDATAGASLHGDGAFFASKTTSFPPHRPAPPKPLAQVFLPLPFLLPVLGLHPGPSQWQERRGPCRSEIQEAVVLAEVIKAFGSPENAQRLEEARDNACNDMGKMLQFLLPVATQIQQDVIKAYGFSNDGEGVLKFARLIKSYESQDPEIASMSGKLKSMFLPPMTLPHHGAGAGGAVATS